MAVVSNRISTVSFTGDVAANLPESAAANTNSPGSVTIHALTTGANTITCPSAGSVPTAATIVPPAGNTQTLTLKGVTGDTGIPIKPVDPCIITLATTATTFCLTAGGVVTGLRIIWS